MEWIALGAEAEAALDGDVERAAPVDEGEDHTVWAVAAAAAAEALVDMDDVDLGRAAEWARKAARKFEKNGRLLLMVGVVVRLRTSNGLVKSRSICVVRCQSMHVIGRTAAALCLSSASHVEMRMSQEAVDLCHMCRLSLDHRNGLALPSTPRYALSAYGSG